MKMEYVKIPGIYCVDDMTEEELFELILGAAKVDRAEGITISDYLKDFEEKFGKTQ